MMNKKLLIALGVVAAAAAGYFLYDQYGSALLGSGQAGAQGSASAQADRELLLLLEELSSIKLDADFFTDPAFVSLKNFDQAYPEQPVGRANPFAPIGR